MTTRILLASAVLATCVTVTLAQSNVLPATALMKENGRYMYGVLGRMAKGEVAYDQAKVDEAIAKLAEDAAKIPAAFPESSKGKVTPDSRYSTSTKAWDNRADFEEYAKNLSKVISDNRGKIKSLEG